MDFFSILYAFVTLVVIWALHWMHKWRNPKCNIGRLPPGSMGLPLIGETIQFFLPYKTMDISPFIKHRVERYGAIFKTNLVGFPLIISTDPDFNHFVFMEEGKLFQSWYPDSFTEIFGRDNLSIIHDSASYKYLKKIVLKLVGPEALKDGLIHDVEKASQIALSSWSTKPSVELRDSISAMIFKLTTKKLISYDEPNSLVELRKNFDAFIGGLISFPINLPGTSYYKCLQGRKNAMKVLKSILRDRQNASNSKTEDFYDDIIEELKSENPLINEKVALDLMFVLLFATFETTSLALTLGMKLLTDNPNVVEELIKEHEGIVKSREKADSAITWKEYKSMTFTFQVINEIVRLANIVPGIFRKTMKDIEIKGYAIPKGWGLMVCPPAVHLNKKIYTDPLTFNPWRWKYGSDINGGGKHFMAFGGGMRFCVGADFSKLLMAIFIHSLVTKYSWKEIKGGNIVRTPGLVYPDGYHIKLTKKIDNNHACKLLLLKR